MNPVALEEEARRSPYREACKTLHRGKYCRIGVGARVQSEGGETTFFFEVIVSLSSSMPQLKTAQLEKRVAILKELEKRGYFLAFDDADCVSCEITLPPQDLSSEYDAIVRLMEKDVGEQGLHR